MDNSDDGVAAPPKRPNFSNELVLEQDPYRGHLFVFRGKRGALLQALYRCDGGLRLFAKRLEEGCFAGRVPILASLHWRQHSLRSCSRASTGVSRSKLACALIPAANALPRNNEGIRMHSPKTIALRIIGMPTAAAVAQAEDEPTDTRQLLPSATVTGLNTYPNK